MPLTVAHPKRPLAVLVVVLLLGGLWHGASWTFVVWGAYHGILLALTHLLARRAKANPDAFVPPVVVQIAVTFYLVTIGWVLFRAQSLGRGWDVIRGMHAPRVASNAQSSDWIVLALVMLAIALFTTLDYVVTKTNAARRPLVLWPSVVLATGLAVCIGSGANAFIYFQFYRPHSRLRNPGFFSGSGSAGGGFLVSAASSAACASDS